MAFLHVIADELAEIHRAREYCEWRSEAKHRVHHYLSRAAPFSDFVTAWVFMGDGASSFVGGNFGGWAIDRLIEKMAPEDVLALFREEVARNAAVYVNVSPAFGVEITEVCELVTAFALPRPRPTCSVRSTNPGDMRGRPCRSAPVTLFDIARLLGLGQRL